MRAIRFHIRTPQTGVFTTIAMTEDVAAQWDDAFAKLFKTPDQRLNGSITIPCLRDGYLDDRADMSVSEVRIPLEVFRNSAIERVETDVFELLEMKMEQ